MKGVTFDSAGPNGPELTRLHDVLTSTRANHVAVASPIDPDFLPTDKMDLRRASKIQRRLDDEHFVFRAAILTRMVELGAEKTK